MLALRQRVQYGGRGSCKLDDSLPAYERACETTDRAFNKQNTSVWGNAPVQSCILCNVLACSAQPRAENNELPRSRL